MQKLGIDNNANKKYLFTYFLICNLSTVSFTIIYDIIVNGRFDKKLIPIVKIPITPPQKSIKEVLFTRISPVKRKCGIIYLSLSPNDDIFEYTKTANSK
jgi:hypothetical protein